MPVIYSINWSEFKQKIEKGFPKQAKRILEIIDECEYKDEEN